MISILKSYSRLIIIGLLVAMLGGCASAPSTAPPPGSDADKAAQAVQQGNWDTAGRLWSQAATTAEPANASLFQLNAADAWLNAGQPGRTKAALGQVDSALLARSDQARLALINAELALEDGDLERSEFYLSAAQDQLNDQLRGRYRQLKRELDRLKSDPYLATLKEAGEITDGMIGWDTAQAVTAMQVLEDVPSGRLQEIALGTGDTAEWAALSLAVRQTLVSGLDLSTAARDWVRDNPRSSIDSTRFMELCWQYGQLFQPPAKIAVLLPEPGSLEAAGAAIRDGMLAAYTDRPAASQLDFIAMPEDPSLAMQTYRRIESEGYQWIIGPLRRETVQSIVNDRPHRIPSLLLNQFQTQAGLSGPPFGLSLSQPREAEALATLMLDSGFRRAILLVADSSWGARVEVAFTEIFEESEGEVIAVEYFNPAESDHSERLTGLLKIADSRQRKDQLQAAIGVPLSFEATRRDDFDAIFMAASPTLGRQLKPQLRFYDAGNKPVYAMGRIFEGKVDTAADQDLNGVIFAATRWALAPDGSLPSFQSTRGGAFGSLYALGNDAWNVLPWLGLLQKDPDLEYHGAVGVLTSGPGGQLEREPVWARISRGRPVAYDAPHLP